MLANCQSICSLAKRQDLLTLCSFNSLSLLFLTETWLSSNVSDNEVFLGASYKIVCRLDRLSGQHGGLLIAASVAHHIRVVDFSLPNFPFSLACGTLESNPTFFILIYNPPATSGYRIDVIELIDCLNAYMNNFQQLIYNSSMGPLHRVILLGDFNFPGIDWNMLSSCNSQESLFIDGILELELIQLVDSPTHIRNGTPDLLFSNDECISLSVSSSPFYDHFPIYFSVAVFDYSTKCSTSIALSKSSFSPSSLNLLLSPLYDYISCSPYDRDFSKNWYNYLNTSLNQCLTAKRLKRLKAPIYFSSHTMQVMNMKETNQRDLAKSWSLLLSLKQIELNKSLAESVELDKILFIDQFNLSSSKQCFKLLRTLGFNSNYPSVMFYNGNQFSSDLEKAEAFNSFFVSVFAAKIGYNNSAPPSSKINLHEVDILPKEIHDALLSCDDSTSTGSDQIPSFVLRSCANILTPVICSRFSWVLRNKKWPQGWKNSYVTPLYKSDSRSQIANYRPISILPKISLILEKNTFQFNLS